MQTKAMRTLRQRGARRGQSDFEATVLLLALFAGFVGFLRGAEYGSRFGVWGGVLGGVAGAIAGLVGTIVAAFLLGLALSPLDEVAAAFGRWWRPYPPVCENGTCLGRDDYHDCEIPEEVVKRVKGLCRRGYRCKCGNIYATGYDYGMQRRFIRVLPDGTIRPYLRFKVFGRWRPDDGKGIIEITPEYVEPTPLEIPGWVIPCVTTAMFGGIAGVAVFFEDGFKHAIAPWFVLGVAGLGLASGCVVWWIGLRRKQ